MNEYDVARLALQEVVDFIDNRMEVQDKRHREYKTFVGIGDSAKKWLRVVAGNLNVMERNDHGKGKNNDEG